MKSIRVGDQPRLSLGRTLRITVDGIRYRLFRSLVTVCVIGVAVAFLLNILSESLVKRAVARDTRERIDRSRLVHIWTARLGAPGTAESILREVAGSETGETRALDLARLGGLTDDEALRFQECSRLAVRYLDFFAGMDYGRRRRLVHQSTGIGVFDRLAAEGGFDGFLKILKNTRSVRLTGKSEELQAFLREWPQLRRWIDEVQAGQAAGVERIAEEVRGQDLMAALAEAEGDFGRIVREAGFTLDEEMARVVAAQARQVLDIRILEKSLEERATRQVIARHHDILPGDVTAMLLWRFVSDPERAEAYLGAIRETDVSNAGLTPDRLVALAAYWREMNLLERADRLTADMGRGWLGLGQRMTWLLLVSMLVCAIGISNAMLMTVTERFREIATLKCLGALDGFIMVMFVLESCIMGAVGGIVGGLLGVLLGVARMLVSFGVAFATSVPIGEVAVSMGIAVLVGIVLAAIAAVYPSFCAARLAPMEAMRVE